MPKRPAVLKRMLDELHRQHACYGHIDLEHLKEVSSELSKEDPENIDADHLHSLLSVQRSLLTDMLTVFNDHKDLPRIKECMAVNEAMSSYMKSGAS